MVTLRDVARRVGVSPKTVSRVVNKDPAVTAETRDAVLAEIARSNYVPDLAARMMRTSTSKVVGFMTDVVATTPYTVDIVRGAQAALRDEGRTLLIANTDGDAEVEAEFWRLFRAHKVAGAIVATMYHRACTVTTDFDRPIVLANCYPPERDRPSVLPDDEAGGYAQARHVLALGHRAIGFVTLNPVIDAYRLRLAGYRRAFAEAGVTFPEHDLRAGFAGPVTDESLVAFRAALDLLDRPERPTAIICGNDKVALQVYGAAAQLGLSIPGDLSVMGFDDMRVVAETLHPALTTVALPYYEIGRKAVELLGTGAGGGEPLLLDCPLVERQSCRSIG